MSDLKLPGEDAKKKKKGISFNRIMIWVLVGGIGIYLLVSGIIGILVKAN